MLDWGTERELCWLKEEVSSRVLNAVALDISPDGRLAASVCGHNGTIVHIWKLPTPTVAAQGAGGRVARVEDLRGD